MGGGGEDGDFGDIGGPRGWGSRPGGQDSWAENVRRGDIVKRLVIPTGK